MATVTCSTCCITLLSAINWFGRIDYRIIVEKCPHFVNSILFCFPVWHMSSTMIITMVIILPIDPYSISSNMRTERFILRYSSTSSSTLFVHPFTSVFLPSVVRSLVVYSVFHVFLRSFICWLVVCESLLVTCHFSLLASLLDYLLLVTRFLLCFFNLTCYFLLATCHLSRVTC